jgi:hypothetical protein
MPDTMTTLAISSREPLTDDILLLLPFYYFVFGSQILQFFFCFCLQKDYPFILSGCNIGILLAQHWIIKGILVTFLCGS